MYTKYPTINNLLDKYKELVLTALGDEVIAIYLTGSLTYDDFQPSRSDIDLHTITKQKLTPTHHKKIIEIHNQIESIYPEWKEKVEASYTPIYLFKDVLPPKEPRPWYGFGKLYEEAPYGNEWIINNYILQEFGIPLYGKDF